MQKRMWKDCESQKGWMFPRKQCLLDTAGEKYTDCGRKNNSFGSGEVKRGSEHRVPFLTKKLFATDIHQ